MGGCARLFPLCAQVRDQPGVASFALPYFLRVSAALKASLILRYNQYYTPVSEITAIQGNLNLLNSATKVSKSPLFGRLFRDTNISTTTTYLKLFKKQKR
jgi:hypothetical protein